MCGQISIGKQSRSVAWAIGDSGSALPRPGSSLLLLAGEGVHQGERQHGSNGYFS
jgi:hypothetical protein